DYIDGGAEDERTLRANEAAFAELTWRPRSAVVHPEVDLRTTVLGHELSLPVILAPVGSSRMFWPRGEAQAAAAAGEAGTVYTLSTLSGTRMEEVREASSGPCWYQLYLCGGREVGLEAVARAKACGYSALVVTIDTPVAGMRERDVRNGSAQLIARRFPAALPLLPQVLDKPGWVLDFWRDGFPMDCPNILLPVGPMPYADIGAQLAAAAVSWDDVAWIAEAWDGPIVVKGVHTADDARRAVDVAASAVVVSNHGGRQLDGVAATLRVLPEVVAAGGHPGEARPGGRVLPEVVAAVGDRVEVLLDGGVRRGGDVAKALALGARAVLVGRAYAYGLGAAGREGVAKAIDILRTELERTLKLLGCPSVHDLDASYLGPPAGWPAAPPERAAAAAR